MVNVHIIFWALLFYHIFLYFGGVFEKTIISLTPVGCDMIIPNSALCALLATYPMHTQKCISAHIFVLVHQINNEVICS